MIPDVVGLTLGDARSQLERAGIEIASIEITSPPRQKNISPENFFRVIRIEVTDKNKAKLLVCKPL